MIITAAEMAARRDLREAAPLAKIRLDDRQVAILARAVTRTQPGRPANDARIARAVAPPRPTAARPRVALSQMDTQVLRLLAQGLENAEIGYRINGTEHVVKSRLKRIFAALQARNRVHAVALGYELGLLGSASEGLTAAPGGPVAASGPASTSRAASEPEIGAPRAAGAPR